MKKIMIIFMALIMVLTVTAISLGAANISGDLTATYQTKDESKDSDDLNYKKDKIEGSIKFNSKLNDFVSFNANFKWDDKFDLDTDEGSNVKTKNVSYFWNNETYLDINGEFGKFKVGMWEIKTYNCALIDNDASTYGKMKAPFTLGYTSPNFNGFTAGLTYLLDENSDYDAKVPTDEGAYVATLAYTNDDLLNLKADLNLIDVAIDDVDSGYTLNAEVSPLGFLTTKLHYGSQVGENDVMILGLHFKANNAYFIYEQDLADEHAAREDFNTNAYAVGYNFTNGVTAEYRLKELKEDAAISEFRMILKFK